MRFLKTDHKKLMIIEAGYIFCKRHNLNYENFTKDVFLADETLCEDGGEFDNICNDLRCYRCFETYKLIEITEEEYEMCIDKFGEKTYSKPTCPKIKTCKVTPHHCSCDMRNEYVC